jgi:hypothetical protein
MITAFQQNSYFFSILSVETALVNILCIAAANIQSDVYFVRKRSYT